MTDPLIALHGVPLGRLIQEVTSVTLVNNTALTIDKTVPSGKRRILLSFRMRNPDDVQRTISAIKYVEAAKTNWIKSYYLATALGATASIQWPGGTPSATAQLEASKPWELLDPGNTIAFTWASGGASTGAVGATDLVIEYLEIDL